MIIKRVKIIPQTHNGGTRTTSTDHKITETRGKILELVYIKYYLISFKNMIPFGPEAAPALGAGIEENNEIKHKYWQ